MNTADSMLRELADNVSHHLDCTRRLAATLQQEREALLGTDVAALEHLVMEKSAAANELRDLGEALTRLRARRPAPTMDAFFKAAGAAPQLASDWREVLRLAADCQAANRANASILDTRQGRVRESLGALRGQAPAPVYGRGLGGSGFTPRSLGSA